MRTSIRKTMLALVIGPVGAVLALNAPAQTVALQLWNPDPTAGSITVSAPFDPCDASCTLAVPLGDTVTLTAVPAAGHQFDGWADDCSTPATTCTLRMDGNKFVAVAFKSADAPPMTAIHRFHDAPDGWGPSNGALLADGGWLYGMTAAGGAAGGGTIFRETLDGSRHESLHQFVGGASDGFNPHGSLIDFGGMLYGTTYLGGTGFCFDGAFPDLWTPPPWFQSTCGTVFRINPDGSGFALLHLFTGDSTDGGSPNASLLAFDGRLYGTTTRGTIFRINPDGSGYTILHTFGDESPAGTLIVSAGQLYGMTRYGGLHAKGTIFRMNPDGSEFQVVYEFEDWISGG
ncbi:MAG TPA: choice-of-anchor tandem repeat GloVer-containing protein, partial [Thermoanaerobaculaceae bacterium]|nr:choice-of-anchor tandem repeat GloVer-containing protein [Thermoanaerobaculaceae bacterium]